MQYNNHCCGKGIAPGNFSRQMDFYGSTEINFDLPLPGENVFLAKKRFSPNPFPKYAEG